MMFTDDSNQTRLAKDPAVVRFGKYYYMYYSNCRISCGSQGEEKAVWGIGIARSTDLENWEKLQDMDMEGELEANGICAPGALIFEGKLHLFYQTYGSFEKDAICHAWSEAKFGSLHPVPCRSVRVQNPHNTRFVKFFSFVSCPLVPSFSLQKL